MEKLVEKTDGDGNIMLVPNPDINVENTSGTNGSTGGTSQKKIRHKPTNITPKKKKRKKNKK